MGPLKAFSCRVCDATLYFENLACVRCETKLGYSRDERAIVPLRDDNLYVDSVGKAWRVCKNLDIAGCTWLTAEEDSECFSCSLTRTRPHDDDEVGMAGYRVAEQAKRRLIIELDGLGFPIVTRADDPRPGWHSICCPVSRSTSSSVTTTV